MNAMYYLNDQKKLADLDLPMPEKFAIKGMLKKVKGTYIEELMKKYKLMQLTIIYEKRKFVRLTDFLFI